MNGEKVKILYESWDNNEFVLTPTAFQWVLGLRGSVLESLSPCNGLINIILRDSEKDILLEDLKLDGKNRRIVLPEIAKKWFETHFTYSYLQVVHGRKIKFSGTVQKANKKALKSGNYLPYPNETISFSGDMKKNALVIQPCRIITPDNAQELLKPEDVKQYLKDLLEEYKKSIIMTEENSKPGDHIYVYSGSTNWMTAEEYASSNCDVPGIYTLRRLNGNSYEYYIGKAKHIGGSFARIKSEKDANGKWTVGHPNNTDEINKRYTDVRYDPVNFSVLSSLYKNYYEVEMTDRDTSKLQDSILYAIEDIAIQTARMILKSEDSNLQNKAFSKNSNKAILESDVK